MKTEYYVCGIGYDEKNNVTDYGQSLGVFDKYVDAYEFFVKLQCRNEASFFIKNYKLYQMLIQIEECEVIENEINCVDVKNEWWITNPHYNDSVKHYEYIALLYAENHGVIEYYVENNQMIYYSSFPLEHSTVRVVVNLDTLKETRNYLSHYYIAYREKIDGKIQANYCV